MRFERMEKQTKVVQKQAQDNEKLPEAAKSNQPSPHDVVGLQRIVGNHGMQHLLAQRKPADGPINLPNVPGVIQTKLSVGAADDQYEQEADRVADTVMSMPDTVQRDGMPEDEELQMKRIQRQATGPGEEDELMMKSEPGGPPPVTEEIEGSIEGSRGNGQSMPDSTRGFFESRFGQDFSGVNIHSGGEADTLNRSLNARAFTTGGDIFFREGEYNPESSQGKELLAHELTHVVQQGASAEVKRKTAGEECDGCG